MDHILNNISMLNFLGVIMTLRFCGRIFFRGEMSNEEREKMTSKMLKLVNLVEGQMVVNCSSLSIFL